MYLYLNIANASEKIWRKFSQYALQILDFTLNMPHEILGPVAPPPPPPHHIISGVPPPPPGSACMLIFHKGHTDTIQVYSVTVMTHVKALQARHSSQGTSEPITPAILLDNQSITTLMNCSTQVWQHGLL